MKNYEYLQTFSARAELARRNFRDFVPYVMPTYQMHWFHEVICDKLEQFNRGEIKKLMLFVPPQHGKSQLSTRMFPAYLLGKDPKRKIVVASYNATLASRFNRDIQRVIDNSLFHDVFPDTYLNNSNVVTVSDSWLRNSEVFETVGFGGFVKTVGRGGALTGTPVDIGIIDDPLKDRAEAMSSTIREALWSWYVDVFESRLHNDSQQILIQTRWHEEDLGGRLLARDNDWEVIIFEAIKENEYDYDPRKIGEALWPEKHSLERIEKIRDTSPLTFNSLYQQSPRPLDSVGIYWTRPMLSRQRLLKKPDLERVVIAIDPATTKTQKSDETGITVQGKAGQHGYLLEDLSGKYSPQEWATVAVQAARRHNATAIVAEKNQGGDMVEAMIRQVDQNIRVILVNATKGKAVRAEPIFGLYEQGRIWHVGEFPQLEAQMVTFNPDAGGASPDRVDALVWGFTELLLGNRKPGDSNAVGKAGIKRAY
jgi:phage terminase large subunit-like protein